MHETVLCFRACFDVNHSVYLYCTYYAPICRANGMEKASFARIVGAENSAFVVQCVLCRDMWYDKSSAIFLKAFYSKHWKWSLSSVTISMRYFVLCPEFNELPRGRRRKNGMHLLPQLLQ